MATNEEFERVIGHISILFAGWDFFVAGIIERLVVPGTEVRNLDESTLSRKLRYLNELDPDEVVKPDLLRRIQSDLPSAFDVSRERGGFLRDMWAFRPEKISRGLIERIELEAAPRRGRDRLGFQARDHSLAQLCELAGKLRRQHDLFLGFLSELERNFQPALRSRNAVA